MSSPFRERHCEWRNEDGFTRQDRPYNMLQQRTDVAFQIFGIRQERHGRALLGLQGNADGLGRGCKKDSELAATRASQPLIWMPVDKLTDILSRGESSRSAEQRGENDTLHHGQIN